ncbi:hypothetical protein KY348_00830 [Candidatus Woesearchaeota archaeon]|nr:hypothetical protein [Candidatus Woesearchaeota archaeon]
MTDIMRVIYSGTIEPVKTLLSDLRTDKKDFNKLINCAVKNLSAKRVDFQGDLYVPKRFFKYKPTQEDFDFYLPILKLNTYGDYTVIYFDKFKGEDDTIEKVNEAASLAVNYHNEDNLLLSTKVSLVNIPFKDDQVHNVRNLIMPSKNVEYKPLSSFKLYEFSLSQNGMFDFHKKWVYNNYDISDILVQCDKDQDYNIKIEALGKESEGYAFANKLAEILPSKKVLFRDISNPEKMTMENRFGWETIVSEGVAK